jgi:hypothetical protein
MNATASSRRKGQPRPSPGDERGDGRSSGHQIPSPVPIKKKKKKWFDHSKIEITMLVISMNYFPFSIHLRFSPKNGHFHIDLVYPLT